MPLLSRCVSVLLGPRAFERRYAKRSGDTVDELRSLGRVVRRCRCGDPICEGWQMVSREAAAEIDDPTKPWAR